MDLHFVVFETLKTFVLQIVITAGIYAVATLFGGIFSLILALKWLASSSDSWKVKDRSHPPSSLQHSKYGRHSYVKLKDVNLHYVENGDRSKPLMLFVHGFPEFWFTWRKQLPVFAKTHWVVALDMRGFNESSKPKQKSSYQIRFLTKDIQDFVHGLGRQSCTLVGHDWGGIICWETTITYPKLVDKLIILNAPHVTAYSTLVTSSIRQVLKSWYVFLFYLPCSICEIILKSEDFGPISKIFGPNISEDELEAYKYTWSTNGIWEAPLNYYTHGFRPIDVVSPQKRSVITAPTLIIWGQEDDFLSWELAALSAKHVKNASVQIISKASHFPQWDAPDEVNRLISNFIY